MLLLVGSVAILKLVSHAAAAATLVHGRRRLLPGRRWFRRSRLVIREAGEAAVGAAATRRRCASELSSEYLAAAAAARCTSTAWPLRVRWTMQKPDTQLTLRLLRARQRWPNTASSTERYRCIWSVVIVTKSRLISAWHITYHRSMYFAVRPSETCTKRDRRKLQRTGRVNEKAEQQQSQRNRATIRVSWSFICSLKAYIVMTFWAEKSIFPE